MRKSVLGLQVAPVVAPFRFELGGRWLSGEVGRVRETHRADGQEHGADVFVEIDDLAWTLALREELEDEVLRHVRGSLTRERPDED